MVTEGMQNTPTIEEDTDHEANKASAKIRFPDNQGFSHMPKVIQTGCCMAILVTGLFTADWVRSASDDSSTTVPAADTSEATEPDTSLPDPASGQGDNEGIQRQGEGRLFYTTIQIPADAETLYVSGSGASPDEDGNWGDMEEQTINTFEKFKATLEERGWSMSDIVQVRAFAVAGEYGLLDFDGFNRGYQQFFGTEDNPNKPVRSFVQVADLVVEGWLVEVEIRAARTPDQ